MVFWTSCKFSKFLTLRKWCSEWNKWKSEGAVPPTTIHCVFDTCFAYFSNLLQMFLDGQEWIAQECLTVPGLSDMDFF